jgi:hypothetical protein
MEEHVGKRMLKTFLVHDDQVDSLTHGDGGRQKNLGTYVKIRNKINSIAHTNITK